MGRDEEYKNRLIYFLSDKYGFQVNNIYEIKGGYYGEVWCLENIDFKYFVKIINTTAQRKRYESSFLLLNYLNECGIKYISKPIKALDGSLCTVFNNSTLGVFDWIEGKNIQNEKSKIAEYDILSSVYSVSKPGIDIPVEDLSISELTLFYKQYNELSTIYPEYPKRETYRILELLESKSSILQHRANRLLYFSELCKYDKSNFYITHGDAGGNIITDDKYFYLVDWDSAMYAPPERDAWFCLNRDWAISAFHKSLNKYNIKYELKQERLVYYCYKYFFTYLNNYIEMYFEGNRDSKEIFIELTNYFNCWIENNIEYADKI